MVYQPVQFVRDDVITEMDNNPLKPVTMLFKCADGLLFDYTFRQLEWGFEIYDMETGFYGLFSGGQHGRWECTLIHVAIDGGLQTIGKASIAFDSSLAEWFNGLLNQYHQKCLESRIRVKKLVSDAVQSMPQMPR